MIVELISCDTCDWTDRMAGSVVPQAWIVTDTGHYCSTGCMVTARNGDAE